jgi:hypothetical protein
MTPKLQESLSLLALLEMSKMIENVSPRELPLLKRFPLRRRPDPGNRS